MFNITVIRLRDIIKYPIIIAIAMIMLYCITKPLFKDRNNEKDNINFGNKLISNLDKYALCPIDQEFKLIQEVSRVNQSEEVENLIDENIDDADRDFMLYILDTAFKAQFGVIDVKEKINNNTHKSVVMEENNESKEEENKEVTLASNSESTNVVTKNPIKEKYTDTYSGVKVKNETDYKLTDKVLNPKSLNINNENILIFHTHTCESYTQSDNYKYKPSGNFRTTDLKYSVARVGDELTTYLSKYKFNVNHNKTYHDYPAYTGSYNRSLETVQKILKNDKSDIIIDLHRDAIGSNSSYAPTVKIGEDYCAQLMFVIGTNRRRIRTP